MHDALTILGPAMLAGLLVLATHVPLGRQVLQRGIIFIDLAVAQAAATGALVGALWFDADHGWAQQGMAAGTALVMVTGLHALERHWPEVQEALIGASFVVLACVALLITASDPQGGEHVQDLLAGQILWAHATQLGWLAAITVAALLCMRIFSSPLMTFYIPFALAITTAVQVIGVYLVFASLIFPALACRALAGRQALAVALIAGVTGYGTGLVASMLADLPSGPTIVVTLALACAISAIGVRFALRRDIRYNRRQSLPPE